MSGQYGYDTLLKFTFVSDEHIPGIDSTAMPYQYYFFNNQPYVPLHLITPGTWLPVGNADYYPLVNQMVQLNQLKDIQAKQNNYAGIYPADSETKLLTPRQGQINDPIGF